MVCYMGSFEDDQHVFMYNSWSTVHTVATQYVVCSGSSPVEGTREGEHSPPLSRYSWTHAVTTVHTRRGAVSPRN